MVKAYKGGSYLHMERNPHFFGSGQHIGGHLLGPYIDGMLFKFYGTSDVAILALKKGNIDMFWWGIEPGYLDDLKKEKDIQLIDQFGTAEEALRSLQEALDLPEPQASGWEFTTEARPAGREHKESWQHRTISMSDIGSGVVVGLLVLLLGAQWVYFNRDALAARDVWRPSMERFCEVLMCELPMRVELADFGIVERDVRKHPTVEEALLINVAFENRATFNQPYPLFEVSFTDSTGAPVAMRRFTPAEYLGDMVDPAAGMSPHAPAQVVLEVIDPGEQAVSFQFGFL